MRNKLQFVIISLLISFGFIGKAQISQDLRNLNWSNNDKYVIYGHTIQPVFGDISWKNKFDNPPKTNIAYKNINQLLDDLNYTAETEKWDSLKLNKEIKLLKKSAAGGRVYLYLDRTSNDLANLKYFFSIVRETDKKETEIFKIFFKQNEPYIVYGDRFASEVTFDINKEVPDSIYIYVNDNQTEALSDYKFKVITVSKTEKFVSYYPNNQVKIEGTLEGGLQTGKWVKYYENGKICVIEYYKNGKLDGKVLEYYDDGKLMAEREYKNGFKTGLWKQYGDKLLLEGSYQDNKREGIWNFYDIKGNPKASGTYKNGMKNGNWIFYNNNHIESEGGYLDDAENGEWKIYDSVGSVKAKGMLKSGKEVPDTWVYYIDDVMTNKPDTNVLLVVDVMPQFRDGGEGMIMFIKDNANFPAYAREQKIKGKVFVSIIVEPNGTLSNITILKGLDAEIDKEIIRVFSVMPRWIPGFQNGHLHRVKMILPINIEV